MGPICVYCTHCAKNAPDNTKHIGNGQIENQILKRTQNKTVALKLERSKNDDYAFHTIDELPNQQCKHIDCTRNKEEKKKIKWTENYEPDEIVCAFVLSNVAYSIECAVHWNVICLLQSK